MSDGKNVCQLTEKQLEQQYKGVLNYKEFQNLRRYIRDVCEELRVEKDV